MTPATCTESPVQHCWDSRGTTRNVKADALKRHEFHAQPRRSARERNGRRFGRHHGRLVGAEIGIATSRAAMNLPSAALTAASMAACPTAQRCRRKEGVVQFRRIMDKAFVAPLLNVSQDVADHLKLAGSVVVEAFKEERLERQLGGKSARPGAIRWKCGKSEARAGPLIRAFFFGTLIIQQIGDFPPDGH